MEGPRLLGILGCGPTLRRWDLGRRCAHFFRGQLGKLLHSIRSLVSHPSTSASSFFGAQHTPPHPALLSRSCCTLATGLSKGTLAAVEIILHRAISLLYLHDGQPLPVPPKATGKSPAVMAWP